MRLLYTLLFYLILPFILLRLLWKARKNPGYTVRWQERLGIIDKKVPAHGIWVHAVSVGEVFAAIPMIKNLQQRHPEIPIVITTMTPTGADRVQAIFGDKVTHLFAPYDLPCILKSFLKLVQPRLLIIMETELWPNMLAICAQQSIPILVANARLSEKSARGYQRLGFFTKDMLQKITLMAIQTQIEKERYIDLGLNADRIIVTGSIKFDLEIPADLMEHSRKLREQTWMPAFAGMTNTERLIWIAASTQEGEEDFILQAFAQVKKQLPQTLLVLVPRHPERFAKVTALCQRAGFQVILRSEQKACAPNTEVFIGDTMGELLLFYGAADLAYVGGSLVNTGGQNPLEPAALGLPVIMGPSLYNFAAITQQLLEARAMRKIQNAQELAECVIELLTYPVKRKEMGNHGREVIAKNRGALTRHIELIEKLIK